jgi:hypothetical protein
MPELIDVPLEELEVETEYIIIFPLIDGTHQSYLTEFIEGNYREFLFEVKSIKSDPRDATMNVGDTFTINSQEVTTDLLNRTKYMVLQEQPIYFPPELEDVHVDTDIDEEINHILNTRNAETERSRMLRSLLIGRRPLQSPLLRSAQNSPNLRDNYRTGGKKRTRKRQMRKKIRKRTKKYRKHSSRNKRKNSRKRR